MNEVDASQRGTRRAASHDSDRMVAAPDEHVSIRPGVSILSVLRHLNYRPWYAMAEFVDNSLQSFLSFSEELRAVGTTALTVEIERDDDGGRLIIRDNAAGIHASDYARAFRPAEIPPDRSGLAEFGMGLKSASCWFAPRWTVRTSALGETVERTVTFDIDRIVRDDLEQLDVSTRSVAPETHYTEIVLTDLFRPVRGRTVGKIKEHLGSIYRVFLRRGILALRFDGDPLSFVEPAVLVAPWFRDPSSEPRRWRKEIDFDLIESVGFYEVSTRCAADVERASPPRGYCIDGEARGADTTRRAPTLARRADHPRRSSPQGPEYGRTGRARLRSGTRFGRKGGRREIGR